MVAFNFPLFGYNIKISYCQTLAELRLLDQMQSNHRAYVENGSTTNDGKGGFFYWDTSDTSTSDDSINVIVSSDASDGRWKRLTNSKPTNSIWVSALNGSANASGRIDDPYSTLTAAKNAATSGQTVMVLPGTYDETDLLKNGVNWHFFSGATINYTGISSNALFYATTAITSKIGGHGVFKNLIEGGGIVTVSHASADISITCHSIEAGDGTAGTGVQISSGKLVLNVEDYIKANGYDSIIVGGGTAWITAGQITSTSAADADANGCELTGGTSYINAHQIRSDGIAVNVGGGTHTVTAQEILSDGGVGIDIINSSTINLRVIASRIKSTLTNTSAVSITTGGASKTIYFSNPVFVAHTGATNGITANGAQNVLISGGVLTNKAKHANVTYIGGTETVNAAVI